MDLMRRRNEGTGQVMPLMATGVVLLATLGTVIHTTSNDDVGGEPLQDAVRQAEAEALLAILMDSHGKDSDVQGMERMGLRSTSGGLSLTKMDLMQGALVNMSTTNGLMDYEETMMSLGVPQEGPNQRDFHLRIYPIGLDAQASKTDVSHLRTAYIGHWNEFVDVTVDLDTPQNMADNVRAKAELRVDPAPYRERQLLRSLGVDMHDRLHISTETPWVFVQVTPAVRIPMQSMVHADVLKGDVFADEATYLEQVLPSRLDDYDVLVVGSRVQHQAMTKDAVKDTIRDWVMEGGTLVVLGTAESNTQWLQPLFHVSTRTVNGAPYVNDPGHPLLVAPHDLDWEAYAHTGVAWELSDKGARSVAEDFDHVIQKDGLDILAVSSEGTFGEGRVFLTSFEPHHIARDVAWGEAMDFLHNILVYADKEALFLDYGPPVPDGVQTASASRDMYIDDDDTGLVPMRVELIMW